jgi:hypothetical protein
VIDAEFGRKDHSSISHNCNKKGLKSLDVKTDPELDSTNGKNKKIIINALTNNCVIFQLLIITL